MKIKYIDWDLGETIKEVKNGIEDLIDDAESAIDALNELYRSEATCTEYIEEKCGELETIVKGLEKEAKKLTYYAKYDLSDIKDQIKELEKYGEY